ncbi:MAG TPA: TadE/TadG family type IV pilus assembly protein [Sphingomonas sp.]|nr:TadE/TadG family type IV pilus assembly protein [Sphingomonas sp.]
MTRLARFRRPIRLSPARDARGTAVVELAITLPILLTLIMGILAYGDYFLVAHSVQQAANDAARAAIAGLDAAERASIAASTVETTLRRQGLLDPALAATSVDDDGSTLVVRLAYDDSADPLLHLSFVPTPDPRIRRSAAIRLGGLT